MQIVLIDKFVVPERAKSECLGFSRKIQAVLKTLPGFIEGFVYERRDGERAGTTSSRRLYRDRQALEFQLELRSGLGPRGG